MSIKRSAYDVIDSTIRENRPNEYILYAFAGLFVILGTGAFIFSLWSHQWTLSIGAALESGLFYPAMREVHKIRSENQKIRLLEIPLNNASTANEAAASLHEVFKQEFESARKGRGARTET
jgi:hypothetical protein